MPSPQDDNPLGTPRGAWGKQPVPTISLGARPIARAPAPRVRAPEPSVAPRNILTGGTMAAAPPRREPPVSVPEPAVAVEPPDPTLVSDSVLARTSTARVGLRFVPVAGVGVLVAAVVTVLLLLFRREPAEPAAAPPITAPAPAMAAPSPAVPAPSVTQSPAEPAPAAPRRAARARPPLRMKSLAPELTAVAPIVPPPLAAPAITPQPTPAPSIPPPSDPEVPMTTRLPDNP